MLRQGNVEVAWVPLTQLGGAIRVFGQMLLKGVALDPELSFNEVVDELIKQETRLGIIYEVGPFKPLACWLSDLREDNKTGRKFATIYALSGKSPNKWGELIRDLVAQWARDEGCASFRFYGRLGWTRYDPTLKLLGAKDRRTGLFEKMVLS